MAQINFPKNMEFPDLLRKGALSAFATDETVSDLTAANEKIHFVGRVVLEDPTGGAKTLSSAGGRIRFRTGTAHVFANAGTSITLGIQDVAATAPAQGDGVFDVSAVLTGGSGPTASVAAQSIAMTSGSKTINHGDLIAIGFDCTTIAGVDRFVTSMIFTDKGASGVRHFSTAVSARTAAGVWTSTPNGVPIVALEFDDGTIGWLLEGEATVTITQFAFNSGTGTADEYGNFLQFPTPVTISGIAAVATMASSSSDFEAILYGDPLGTPVVLAKVTVDADTLGQITAANGRISFPFATPVVLLADTPYAVAIRPTTANSITLTYQDFFPNSKYNRFTGMPQDGCYAIRRLDNAGAFSDYNIGVAKTRMVSVSALISGIANDNGIGAGGTGGGFTYIVA